MNHAEVRARLAEHMEGDLSLSQRALVDAHLDQCASCAAELSELKRAVALLRGLPDPLPPAHLAEGVMARIRAGEGELGWLHRLRLAPLPGSRGASRWSGPVLAAAAAAAVALFAVTRAEREAPAPERAAIAPIAEQGAPPNPIVAPPQAPSAPDPGSELVASLPPATAERPAAFEGSELEPAVPGIPAAPAAPAAPPVQVAVAGSSEPAAGAPVVAPVPGTVLPPGVVSPEVIGLPATSRSAPSDAISPDRQERIAHTRDGWLDWIRAHPGAYLKEYERYSAGERPNWIRSLAQRAAERGDLDEVVAALRATGDPLGQEVAGAFEAAARGEEGSALP